MDPTLAEQLTVVILSCDKNSDIRPWMNKTADAFARLHIPVVVTTEHDSAGFTDYLTVIAKGHQGFDERINDALSLCETPYVLLLLDDYFIHDPLIPSKVPVWLDAMERHQLNALRVSKLDRWYYKKSKIEKGLWAFKDLRPYQVDFHPTVWNAESLRSLIDNRSFSPWTLEPLFALYLRDKKAAITNQTVDYSELIIQGRFFPKPFKRYCQNEYAGERKLLPKGKLFSYCVRKLLSDALPYWLIGFARKALRIKSISAEAQL